MRDEAPKLTERERYWLKHIRACEASGQRMSDYAAAQGLNVRALYDGKRTLVRKGVLPAPQPHRFQRAQIVDAVQVGEWRVHLPNGVSVAFSGAVSAGELALVLKAAAGLE